MANRDGAAFSGVSIMAIIRQEINLLNVSLSGTITGGFSADERPSFNSVGYSGTATFYFEVEAKSTVAGANWAGKLTLSSTAEVKTIDQTDFAITTSYALYRKTFTTTLTGVSDCVITGFSNGSATVSIKAARIIIIQDIGSDPLTATETQIEIGSASTVTATSLPTGVTNVSNAKYWKYDSAKWDGVTTAVFEATFKGSTSKTACAVALQYDDGSFGATWTTLTSVTTTSTTPTRVRATAPVTLVAGRNYRIVGAAAESKTGMAIYGAKIIIISSNGSTTGFVGGSSYSLNGGTASSGETQQAFAQGFKVSANATLTAVKFPLGKFATPVDNVVCDIVATLDGSVLATATVAGSSLGTSVSLITFTLGTPLSVTAGTQYYIQIKLLRCRA
jgi:hypothetical protein